MEKNVYGSETATERPVPWPWSSTLSAITLILENTTDPAILLEIDAYLGSNDPRDGQALLDYITAKGVTLPALQSNSHLPDNVIHGNAVAVVTRQYERYYTECKTNTEYSMLQSSLERFLAFVKVDAAPAEIEPSPRYSVTDALIVLLMINRGVDILPILDNFLQNCSYFDAPELMKLFAGEGYNLPGLETIDAIPVGERESVKERLLRERCAQGLASPSIVVSNAARNISNMLLATSAVANSEQMVLNRIKHHPSVFAEPQQVSMPLLPEYVRKTALDLFEQNLLRGCVLIAQYTDIAAGMNLSEEQTEILTKNLRGRYSGTGWPKCYDHTMLVDGAGSAYDQALMLAVCGTAATVDGLQLLQENGHVISQAIEFMENPVCRASVLRLVRGPNAIIGEFNY